MITTILQLGGLQAFLLATFLFLKKRNVYANIILSILLTLLGVSCLLYAFNQVEIYLKYPHLIRIGWGLPLLFGPLLYFYTQSILNPVFKLSRKNLVHAYPYTLNLVLLIPFFMKSGEEKVQVLDYFTAAITSGTDYYAIYYYLLRFAIIGIGLHYCYKSLGVLTTYQESLLAEYSAVEKKKIQWLKDLIWSFISLFILLVVLHFITVGDRYPNFDYEVFFFISTAIITYILSFKSLNQPQLFTPSFESATKLSKPLSIETTSSVSDTGLALLAYMKEKKPYLQPNLSATELAKYLNISRHQLSNILNKELGKNFYDFINEYRVEEFKIIQADERLQHLTLLALAYESGFSSKSSFNAVFKKMTGMTPSAYRKGQQSH